jgi:ribosomal-protein-alanine N-acetyltransferase
MSVSGLQIRAMREIDLTAVVALEASCGLSSWGVVGYERELTNPAAVLLVANIEQDFAGYFAGRVMVDEFELFSLAVLPKWRRQGIARQLLEHGLQQLHERGIQRCWLEVRAANLPARNLYQSYGFATAGRRRNYYHDPPDDAVLMTREGISPNTEDNDAVK